MVVLGNRIECSTVSSTYMDSFNDHEVSSLWEHVIVPGKKLRRTNSVPYKMLTSTSSKQKEKRRNISKQFHLTGSPATLRRDNLTLGRRVFSKESMKTTMDPAQNFPPIIKFRRIQNVVNKVRKRNLLKSDRSLDILSIPFQKMEDDY
mmetsp:Transcript_4199/g.8105  ORF Transcript_4199/g.8105 Transcript_4199/m.8105 type:complete len:148 (+) Transcript_4199:403-846(+)